MAEIIGIDAGSGSTTVYSSERGLILREPSVVAVHRVTKEVAAIGREVMDRENRSGLYRVICPFAEGCYTGEMMRYFLEKAVYGRDLLRPTVVFTVRCDMKRDMEKEMRKGLFDADARAVYMYPRLLAEGCGSGINISAMEASLVVRMGKTRTEMALIAEDKIMRTAYLSLGGKDADTNLLTWMKVRMGLIISEKEAEHIKIHMPPLVERIPLQKMCIQGRDVFTGKMIKKEVSVMEMKKCLLKTYRCLACGITEFIEGTPEPARSDVFERGLLLTGGAASQAGLADYIEKETGLVVLKAPERIEKCAQGAVELYKRRRR